jgi:hypothetical protein
MTDSTIRRRYSPGVPTQCTVESNSIEEMENELIKTWHGGSTYCRIMSMARGLFKDRFIREYTSVNGVGVRGAMNTVNWKAMSDEIRKYFEEECVAEWFSGFMSKHIGKTEFRIHTTFKLNIEHENVCHKRIIFFAELTIADMDESRVTLHRSDDPPGRGPVVHFSCRTIEVRHHTME